MTELLCSCSLAGEGDEVSLAVALCVQVEHVAAHTRRCAGPKLVVDFAILLAGVVAAGVVEAEGVSFVQGHLRSFFFL